MEKTEKLIKNLKKYLNSHKNLSEDGLTFLMHCPIRSFDFCKFTDSTNVLLRKFILYCRMRKVY